jgi:hypothetical protein
MHSPNSATQRYIHHHDSSESVGSENEYKIRGLDSRHDLDMPSHLHKKTNRIYHFSAQTKSILPISRFSLINMNGMKGMMDTTRTLSKQLPSQEQLN